MAGLSFHIASLDESGILNVWVSRECGAMLTAERNHLGGERQLAWEWVRDRTEQDSKTLCSVKGYGIVCLAVGFWECVRKILTQH